MMGFVNGNLQQLLEDRLNSGASESVDMHINVQDGVTIMNYMNAVPPLAELWLDRLYGNIFSSLAHYRIYDGTDGIHTYIACQNEQVLAVLLYRTKGNQVKILNEATPLAATEIARFTRHIFKSYRNIDVISMHAVSLDGSMQEFPLQRFNCQEDIVLRLPASTGEYMARLGKSTRTYLNRYQNKLKRAFPSSCQVTFLRTEIQESHIREILELNRSRMEGKGKRTPWTDLDERRILELARECGMVNVIMIEGRICAGTINYRVNDNYFLEVVAHAPEYNDYRLGTLCCYATICKCIAMGGAEYHFLWGQSEYKYRLGGVQHDLEHVSIFRSRRYMLTNALLVLQNLHQGYERRMRLWVKNVRRRESTGIKPVNGFRHSMNAVRLSWKRKRQSWVSTAKECAADSVKSESPS
jgi:hypothetical protein